MPTNDRIRLEEAPLAFQTTDEKEGQDVPLVSATSRLILETTDGATLNIEILDTAPRKDPSTRATPSYTLLFLPGVCESAETRGTQFLFQEAVQRAVSSSFSGIRIAVLESLGHGLSSGTPGLCPSFDQLITHVVEAVQLLHEQDPSTPIFLSGNSMGGALAMYAAEQLSRDPSSRSPLGGVALIAPAVGIDPRMVPPLPLVLGLKVLAFIAPSTKLSLTPYEDPSHYKLPRSSQRNYQGHWPLATSKMLLDLTSTRVPGDVEKCLLSLQNIPNVLIIAGENDLVVPLASIRDLYDGVACPNRKNLLLGNAGHDLLFQRESAQRLTHILFDWIEKCMSKVQV